MVDCLAGDEFLAPDLMPTGLFTSQTNRVFAVVSLPYEVILTNS